MSRRRNRDNWEPIYISLDGPRTASFNEEMKQVADKMREAAALSKSFGHKGTSEYLYKLADVLDTPTKLPAFGGTLLNSSEKP